MQYDAETPEDYLDLLDDDWRLAHLMAVRRDLLNVPGIEEGIGHGMLQYRRRGEVFAHLNAQKGYVGVYLGTLENIDPGAEIRGRMSSGKTCLRLRKRDDPGIAGKLIALKSDQWGDAKP